MRILREQLAKGLFLAALIGCASDGATAAEREYPAQPAATCLACRFARTGNPQCVAWYARPSNTNRDVGYYAGGGKAFGGEGRFVNEGTFGWDYKGFVLNHRVALSWTHGRLYQGGIGAYKVDGPRIIRPEGERTTTPF